MLADFESAKLLLKIIAQFSSISGLNWNRQKCDGRWLGSNVHRSDQPIGQHNLLGY
jgi:hypothetical protein